MRIIVTPTLTGPSIDPSDRGASPFEGEAGPTAQPNPQPFRWFLPFACKARSYCYSDGVKIATRCGSRGCHECNQRSLREWTSSAMEIKKKRNEKMYGIVLTPKEGRIKTRDDVSAFFTAIRSVMRKWERSSCGLGASYWVGECVIKWDEVPTEIPCPVKLSEPTAAEYRRMSGEAMEAIVTARDHCAKGRECPYCRGAGFLPSVHLHAHLAVMSEPFAYCKKTLKYDFKQTFNGRTFQGLCQQAGLGEQQVQLIYKRRGLSEYMAKSMLVYMEKGAHVQNEKKEVDWNTSAIHNLIASAIYGRLRSRGKNGRAYGIKVKQKDVSRSFSFGGDIGASNGAIEGENEGATLAALNHNWGYLKQERKEDFEPRPTGVILEVMEVGKKVIRSGDIGAIPCSVLNKTQVDRRSTKGFILSDIVLYSREGLREGSPPTLGKNGILARKWNTAAVISADQLYAYPSGRGYVIGRGASAIYCARVSAHARSSVGFQYDLRDLVQCIGEYPYREWENIISGFIPIDFTRMRKIA